MKRKIFEFIKQEAILIVACVLAVISMFFVTPDKAYLESIMKQNAEFASYLANKTLSKVYRKVGFTAK